MSDHPVFVLPDLIAVAEALIRDLAGHNPLEFRPASATFWCVLCKAGPMRMPVAPPDEHAESCPWRRARELTGDKRVTPLEWFRED